MMLELILLKEVITEFIWYMSKDEAINLLINADLSENLSLSCIKDG